MTDLLAREVIRLDQPIKAPTERARRFARGQVFIWQRLLWA